MIDKERAVVAEQIDPTFEMQDIAEGLAVLIVTYGEVKQTILMPASDAPNLAEAVNNFVNWTPDPADTAPVTKPRRQPRA